MAVAALGKLYHRIWEFDVGLHETPWNGWTIPLQPPTPLAIQVPSINLLLRSICIFKSVVRPDSTSPLHPRTLIHTHHGHSATAQPPQISRGLDFLCMLCPDVRRAKICGQLKLQQRRSALDSCTRSLLLGPCGWRPICTTQCRAAKVPR